ncbi:hypothetical protein Tco_1379701 [Tanacetum coccineum]
MCCDDSYHVTPRISALVGCDNMHLKSHLKIALKVLRYLKGSPRKGVHIVRCPKVSLETFVDADWAKCYVTRRSVTGFCLFLNGSLIFWKSKKQRGHGGGSGSGLRNQEGLIDVVT